MFPRSDPALVARRVATLALAFVLVSYALLTPLVVTQGIIAAAAVGMLWWSRGPVDELVAAVVNHDTARALVQIAAALLSAIGAFTVAGWV